MSDILNGPGYHIERIDGVEVQKPYPDHLHAFVETYLLGFVHRALPHPYVVLIELNTLCGGDMLVPDIVVTERSARYDDGDLADPPLLAIEIQSRGETVSTLLRKCERLLAAGTRICWIICTKPRKAWICTEASLHEANDVLVVELPTVRIRVSLAEMWSELPAE